MGSALQHKPPSERSGDCRVGGRNLVPKSLHSLRNPQCTGYWTLKYAIYSSIFCSWQDFKCIQAYNFFFQFLGWKEEEGGGGKEEEKDEEEEEEENEEKEEVVMQTISGARWVLHPNEMGLLSLHLSARGSEQVRVLRENKHSQSGSLALQRFSATRWWNFAW